MKLTVSSCSLSDGSKAWSVVIIDDDNQAASIDCIDEKSALYLYDEITAALEKYTNYQLQ